MKAKTPPRFGMLIEADRCVGCYSCQLACRDEHTGNDHLPITAAQLDGSPSWIPIRKSERGSFPKVKVGYVAVPCLQCADAPCIKAAPEAITRRDDGIVVIDPVKARGQRHIVDSCPYGAISWNEAAALPQKCTFCAHLLDEGWREPRCVEACPTQALVFGDAADPASPLARRLAEVRAEKLPPGTGSPAVIYSGLPAPFIAGEVVLGDRMAEPAVGIAVTLKHGPGTLHSSTDAFGDFEFAGLEAGVHYVLSIAHPGYEPRELRIETGTDCNVGSIELRRE